MMLTKTNAWLRRLPIKLASAKPLLMLVLFGLSISGIGIVAGNAILNLTSTFGSAIEQARNNLDAVTTARVSTMSMKQALYHLVVSGSPAEAHEAAVAAIKGASFLDESLHRLEQLLPHDRQVAQLSRLNEQARPIRMKVIVSGMRGEPREALARLHELSPITHSIDSLSQQILAQGQQNLALLAKRNTIHGRRTVWTLAIVIALVLAASFGVVRSNLKLQRNRQRYIDQLTRTNQKLEQVQHQLIQQEKMASIGQLAAGVAHEINNPIGFVSSNMGSLGDYVGQLLAALAAYEAYCANQPGALPPELQALRTSTDLAFLAEDIPSLLDETREGLQRVRKIVQDLKSFSHVGAPDAWQQADIHQGLDSTLNIAASEIKYKARITKAYGQLPSIECIPSQLNQVFLNMLVNAAQAIKADGEISIRTGAGDEHVWIEIGDNGEGIAPESLGRIFDPFFTTKPVGSGTGLGLSLSYGIVRKHGGAIDVHSRLGEGTVFTIRLPMRQQHAATASGLACEST